MAHQDAFKRLRTKSIRSVRSKILIFQKMAPTEDRVWEIRLALSVRFYLTMRNFNRKENLRDKPVRNSLEESLQTLLTVNRLWDQLCLLDLLVASMEVLAAKIWSNLGITILTSSVKLMILMCQRTIISLHLLLLRLSQRQATILLQHQQNQSISRTPRKRELKKTLHQILKLIHHHQMKIVIKRKRRRLQK